MQKVQTTKSNWKTAFYQISIISYGLDEYFVGVIQLWCTFSNQMKPNEEEICQTNCKWSGPLFNQAK